MIAKMNLKNFLGILALLLSGFSFAKERVIDSKELAEHASNQSCWIVVNGSVYDLTEDLERHRKYPVALEEFCGKDGSNAWHSKGSIKKPHSKKAEILLNKFKIGSWQKK